MDRDCIGVGDGINRTPSEHDSISFAEMPSRRSLLFQRFLSIFCCNVSQMTRTVPRCNMQTTSSKQGKETATEAMSNTDSVANNPFHHHLGLTRERLSRFQNLFTDQTSPIPDKRAKTSQAFRVFPKFENPSPKIESFFPPQGTPKKPPIPQNRLNRYTGHVSPVPDTKMSPAMPVRKFAVDSKTRFGETNRERDFVSIQPAGYPRIIPAPYSGDQNSYLNSSESIEDTFPAQSSWGPRRQRRQLQDTRERDWVQSEEVDEKISVGR